MVNLEKDFLKRYAAFPIGKITGSQLYRLHSNRPDTVANYVRELAAELLTGLPTLKDIPASYNEIIHAKEQAKFDLFKSLDSQTVLKDVVEYYRTDCMINCDLVDLYAKRIYSIHICSAAATYLKYCTIKNGAQLLSIFGEGWYKIQFEMYIYKQLHPTNFDMAGSFVFVHPFFAPEWSMYTIDVKPDGLFHNVIEQTLDNNQNELTVVLEKFLAAHA